VYLAYSTWRRVLSQVTDWSVIDLYSTIVVLEVDVQTLGRKRSTYNVILTHVGVTIVVVKSNKHYVF